MSESATMRSPALHAAALRLAALLSAVAGGCAPGEEPVVSRVVDFQALEELLPPASGEGAVLVNFWATWCQPCVTEIPDLIAVASKHAGGDVRVVAVSLDLSLPEEPIDTPEEVAEFVEAYGWDLPFVVYDGDVADLADHFGYDGAIPFTLAISGDGRIVDVQTGSADRHRFERMIAKARR